MIGNQHRQDASRPTGITRQITFIFNKNTGKKTGKILLTSMLLAICGCNRLSVDVWDRKKSDVCEDYEEKSGDCRNGTGVIVGWRWTVRNYQHVRQTQIRTTL
jgi:hypothetical protein